MWEWLFQIDAKIFTLINGVLTHPWADLFFVFITDLHKTLYFKIFAVPLMFLFFFKKFGRQGVTFFIFLILALSVSDFVGGQVKNAVERPRPFQTEYFEVRQLTEAGHYSFYSNHSSNMFVFAAYTSAFFPTAAIPLHCLAALVAYSRVYNGVHYPSDIVFGMLAGLLFGKLFSRLVLKLTNRLQSKEAETP